MRGEWIEIDGSENADTAGGLSPCGESGLKLHPQLDDDHVLGSLPMRGEWIEIPFTLIRTAPAFGLSPCGESGLKSVLPVLAAGKVRSLPMRGEWIEIAAGKADKSRERVSPHAGRVD